MSFSFGTPSSAPASTGLTGFSFGANKPATPGFGLTATSQPSTGLFSTPTSSAPAFGSASTSAFGATSTPAFGSGSLPGFGASATPSFMPTSSAPSFGATNTTPAFGATSTAPAFGTTNTTPAFGATSAAPSFGATGAAPTFGATSTAFGSIGLGGSNTTPGFGVTGLAAGGLNFGAGTNTSTPGTGLSFGAPTSTATTGFGFGTTATTQAGLGLFGGNTSTASTGLFVAAMLPQNNPATPCIPITQTFQMIPPLASTPYHIVKPTCTPFLEISHIASNRPGDENSCAKPDYHFIQPSCGAKLGTSAAPGILPSTSAAPSLGLGGNSFAGPGNGVANTTTSADGKTEPPKQTKLPNEILTAVDSFKEFVKKQKSISSEIMRISVKPLHKVERDAEEFLRSVLSLSGEVAKARAQSKRLHTAGASALAAAETAARDPPNSEYEGTAPPNYVKELITELEQQLITFRRQMDVADKQMQAAPRLLSEQELNLGIRRMHESLVALAGRLQAVHSQVEAQKEQYLNLRKYILKDQTNVFESKPNTTSLEQILRDAESGRKKSKLTGYDSIGSAFLSDQGAKLGNINQLAGPSPFTYMGSSATPLAVAETPCSSWQPQQTNFTSSFNTSGLGTFGSTETSSGFQLQKPPGKRTKQ